MIIFQAILDFLYPICNNISEEFFSYGRRESMNYSTYSCGKCGKPVDKEAQLCPHCGVFLRGIETKVRNISTSSYGAYKPKKWHAILLFGIGIFFLMVTVIFLLLPPIQISGLLPSLFLALIFNVSGYLIYRQL
jgi:DNA-directed RNA polymerase subunit RPC12/RpoP